MITIDEMETMLDEIAETVPQAFYQELNGGILLLEEALLDDENSKDNDLYILGEYCTDPYMGNFIRLYYGSFAALMPDATPEEIREELRETLFHEFTHHIETLAGEYGLDVKDAQELLDYLQTGAYRSPRLAGFRRSSGPAARKKEKKRGFWR